MLLDTHVWIWAAADIPRTLGPKTRRLLVRAAATGALYVSAASAFEITALHTAGRLKFIDRLLVATARDRGIPLLTRDAAILDYARRTRLVRVVDAAT